jgi:hypothetical protein
MSLMPSIATDISPITMNDSPIVRGMNGRSARGESIAPGLLRTDRL